jgi:hypothetical protein
MRNMSPTSTLHAKDMISVSSQYLENVLVRITRFYHSPPKKWTDPREKICQIYLHFKPNICFKFKVIILKIVPVVRATRFC